MLICYYAHLMQHMPFNRDLRLVVNNSAKLEEDVMVWVPRQSQWRNKDTMDTKEKQ